MATGAEERAMVGRKYRVTKRWKIGGCVMKEGDVLSVSDWGHGAASTYVEFRNKRLPFNRFTTGTWLFKSNTILVSVGLSTPAEAYKRIREHSGDSKPKPRSSRAGTKPRLTR